LVLRRPTFRHEKHRLTPAASKDQLDPGRKASCEGAGLKDITQSLELEARRAGGNDQVSVQKYP
jgi:hypothetical protein